MNAWLRRQKRGLPSSNLHSEVHTAWPVGQADCPDTDAGETEMKIELNGKKAIVSGSTAGIGRAIAEGLARAGASVVINGRGEQRVSAGAWA